MYGFIEQVLIFFQKGMYALAGLTTWLWKPVDWIPEDWGAVAPIGIFGMTAVVAILVLHAIHLINVVAG